MMYLFWFVEFIYNVLIVEPLRVGSAILSGILNAIHSIVILLNVIPTWISVPFYALLAISVLFRVSQFIPTIGGASSN